MKADGIINLIARMLTRRATRWSMRLIEQKLSGGDKPAGEALTPAERKARAEMRATRKRARQAARITRGLR